MSLNVLMYVGASIEHDQTISQISWSECALCFAPRRPISKQINSVCRACYPLPCLPCCDKLVCLQIFEKYAGPNGRLLLRACHELFDALPLCALIQVQQRYGTTTKSCEREGMHSAQCGSMWQFYSLVTTVPNDWTFERNWCQGVSFASGQGPTWLLTPIKYSLCYARER